MLGRRSLGIKRKLDDTEEKKQRELNVNDILDNSGGGFRYSIAIHYIGQNGEKYFGQYRCAISDNKLLPYNNSQDYYNPAILLNNAGGKLSIVQMKSFYTRANNREVIDEKGEKFKGLCQGKIGGDFFRENTKMEGNDTRIVLIDHYAKGNDRIKAYILANKNKYEDKDTYSYYINLICSDPLGGGGTMILKWFINFLLLRTTDNKLDPAYKVDSLSLSAISTVLFYYPRFGYLHVKDCSNPKEEKEIDDFRNTFKSSAEKKDTQSDKFINFLFLLTRKGFNYTANDTFCRNISRVNFSNRERENIDDFEIFNTSRRATRRDYNEEKEWQNMKYNEFNVFKKRTDDNEYFRNEYNSRKTAYDNSYITYIGNSNITNRIAYFDATFDLAKFLYENFCQDQGYTEKLCRNNVREI